MFLFCGGVHRGGSVSRYWGLGELSMVFLISEDEKRRGYYHLCVEFLRFRSIRRDVLGEDAKAYGVLPHAKKILSKNKPTSITKK